MWNFSITSLYPCQPQLKFTSAPSRLKCDCSFSSNIINEHHELIDSEITGIYLKQAKHKTAIWKGFRGPSL